MPTFSFELGPAFDTIRESTRAEIVVRDVRTDAINTYGQNRFASVSILVEDSQCQWCDGWASEMAIEDQVMGTCKHLWHDKLHEVAKGYGKTVQEAADTAELGAADYLRQHGHYLLSK